MANEKFEIQTSKEKVKEKTEVVNKVEVKNLLVYKPSIISNYSGLIILLLFIIICYLSVIAPSKFVWLLFGIVSMPLLRRNYNDVSVIILGLALIVCSVIGILMNGVSTMSVLGYDLTLEMAYGTAILGLLYISFITFYRGLKFENYKSLLFYLVVIASSYPIMVIIFFLGSLIGFLSMAVIKVIMYLLIALPVILAFYLILSSKKKVVEVKYDKEA